jgi:hypothetical protein
VPEPPWPMFKLPDDESVKLGALTVRARVVVAVREPDVPVMVNVAVPGVAELAAASVRVLLPVVGFVLHDAVTPAGNVDVTARLALPVKPY